MNKGMKEKANDSHNEEFLKSFVESMNGKSQHMLSSVIFVCKCCIVLAVLGMLAAVLFGYRAIDLASDQRLVPYTVERDKTTGSLLNIGRINRVDPSSGDRDKWAMADLQDFIKNMRQSSLDKSSMVRQRSEAQLHILKGTESEDQLNSWVGEDDIYKRLVDKGEYVIPTSFRKRKIAENTFLINWEEKVKDVQSNREIRREQHRAEFIVLYKSSDKPEVFETNPLGLYVKSLETDLIEVLAPEKTNNR